ncbi:methylated-DNA--[protein]-cysteine S-methyltransferase [bacterium]|nr:methylated-DNA--[protein]-cysteine S-methyltransferase [bacterium]MBU1153063.1 methylated-DNA--[protein]-cysteine S-methyltransferase [bacterium]MBU1782044.1 methylated-DNA--[protein]-cysteine S-methyltransferase [bacterium]
MNTYYTTLNAHQRGIFILYSEEGLKFVKLSSKLEELTKKIENLTQRSDLRLEEDLKDYFKGKSIFFRDYKLDFSRISEFQKKVLMATLDIPYGETRSYKWVAIQIGKDKAYQAVGQALHNNPLPIIIPCHRVIKEDGKLGGFSGGLDWKKRLLTLEQKNVGINS